MYIMLEVMMDPTTAGFMMLLGCSTWIILGVAVVGILIIVL